MKMPMIGPTERQILQAGTLHRILRHHGSQGAIRNVHQGVEEAQQCVSDVGVDVLGGCTVEVRDAEQGDTGQQERKRGKQQVWPELPPTRPREVNQAPGHQVREGVPYSHDKKHRRNGGWIQLDDICVVDEQEQRLQREGQVVGQVTGRVAKIVARVSFFIEAP